MRNLMSRAVLLGTLGATLAMGGCASIDDVKRAQATADQAVSSAQTAQNTATQAGSAAQGAQNTANQALAAAQTAQQGVDKNSTAIASLTQQVQDLTPRRRVAERD